MARNDVVFSEISIKPKDSTEYVNVIDNFQASSTFGGMSIEEGIFNGGVSGFILLNDPNPDNDEPDLPSITTLAKTGSMIRFSFSTEIIENDIKSSLDGLAFYVYNVSIVSDISPGVAKLGSSQAATYRLEFASYESTSIDYETRELEEDYVGTISEFVRSIASSNELGILAPTPDNETATTENTAQVEPQIVPTFNGVWFKSTQSLYPWGKEKSIPSVNTLIRSSLNYAVPAVGYVEDKNNDGDIIVQDPGVPYKENPSYVFYQSLPLGQWRLIPIGGAEHDSLYKQNYLEGNEDAGYHTYRFTMDETITKRIEMFKLIKATDILELQDNGAFGSRYNLIEPNYRGIYNGIDLDSGDDDDEGTDHTNNNIGIRNNTYYHDAMSLASHLKQDYVTYKYEDFNADDEDSDSPLLGRKITNGKENPAFSSLRDSVYGYFDTSYLYKPFPTMNDDYSSGRGNKYMWQTMFDMCEFPLRTNIKNGEVGIKDIVNIRNSNKQCKLSYSVLSDLKEQWNRYRHSICCESSSGGEFLALLVGATWGGEPQGVTLDGSPWVNRNITPYALGSTQAADTSGMGNTVGNMYRYSFIEVEAWPKALIDTNVKAEAFIEGAPPDQKYFDYLVNADLNPSNGFQQVYIPGNAGNDYETKNTDTDSDDFGQPIANGITFQFGLTHQNENEQKLRINQAQEMFVIPVSGGKRGLFSAYNTIELTNNKAFTGAGINTKGFNYPGGFNLMEIGGMTVGTNAGEGTTPIPASYMGTLVRMTPVNSSDLNEIKTRADLAELGIGGYCEDADGNITDATTEEECRGTWTNYGGEDAYTGPEGYEPGICCPSTYLLNTIMGTENLPTTFAGPPSKLQCSTLVIERDDIGDRPDISSNASPEKVNTTTTKGNETVFMFAAENDHDGRCTP